MRSKKIIDTINQVSYQLLSLDVFDTLLFRSTREPTDIFSIAYHKLKEKYPLFPVLSHVEYKELRIKAEIEARKKYASKEIKLQQIAKELATEIKGITEENIIAAELEAEMENININNEII